MANNLMYLVNRKNGASIYIGKYYPSTGWIVSKDIKEDMAHGFFEGDFGHLTQDQLLENEKTEGFENPHKSSGGIGGDDWFLKYD